MAKWHFAGADGMPGFGLNDAGMESFRGAPVISLAREICQNSTDALPKELKEKFRAGIKVPPVEISFKVIEGEFPDSIGLLAEMGEMQAYYKKIQKNDKKVLAFLERAQAGLKKHKISFLKISDYGTTGLCGVDEIGTPWDNLIMSDGNSDKELTDGGSKGIGHSAAFVNTDLQVVFYQTKNIEGKTGAAGVARLVSRRKLDGSRYGWAGIGFFGEGTSSMDSLPEIPVTIDPERRTKVGTDVYIAGFNKSDWVQKIVCSAVDSFLLGFYKDRLRLDVAGNEVSSSKLNEIIAKYGTVKGAFPHHADQYYKVLTSSKTHCAVKEISADGRKGTLRLRLLTDMDMDVRKVAMIRDNGMLIFEQDHISGTIPFAGVLEIEGKELNGYLRSLENPQHTEWSADRAPAESQKEAQEFIHEISRFCRETLNDLVKAEPGQKVDSGLGYLENPGDFAETGNEAEDINDEFVSVGKKQAKANVVSRPGSRPHRKKVRVKKEDGEGEGQPDRQRSGESSGGGGGGGGLTIHGDNPVPIKEIEVGVEDVCSVCCDKENSEYEIQFIPEAACKNGKIKLFAVAETDNYEARVLSARTKDGKTLTVENGNVICGFDFVKGNVINLLVRLDYTDYCSLEMEAYGSN